MTVGGSLFELAVKGRTFAATADADAARKLGGFENEVQANGNGTARKIMMRVPWNLAGVVVDVDDNRGDQEFLQEVADSQEFVSIALTFPGDITYEGLGTITGEIIKNSQAATCEVGLSGPGSLSKQ